MAALEQEHRMLLDQMKRECGRTSELHVRERHGFEKWTQRKTIMDKRGSSGAHWFTVYCWRPVRRAIRFQSGQDCAMTTWLEDCVCRIGCVPVPTAIT
jgi:hypothetical protein